MKGAGWNSAVLVLAGWWGGRCQKASLDSREEAVKSSSPGSLSDLNTNTDVPLIPVQPYIPPLASLLSFRYFLLFSIPPTRLCPSFNSQLQSAPVHLYSMLLCVPPFLAEFCFLCLSVVFVAAVSVSEAKQSLITGKCTQRRKQTPQGGVCSFCSEKRFSQHAPQREIQKLEHRCCSEHNKHCQMHCNMQQSDTNDILCTI